MVVHSRPQRNGRPLGDTTFVASSLAAFLLVLLGAAITLVSTSTADAQQAAVRLNEAQSSNTSFETASGSTPDWIELYNSSAASVDLSGWSLSDDIDEPGRWVFPAGTTIAANSTLVVFASDRDGVFDGELHTNFKLSAGGDTVVLFDADGATKSAFDPLPPLPVDGSWGVTDSGELRLFSAATPGAPNAGNDYAGLVREVSADPGRGVYTAPVQVTLAAAPGETIRYTVDGSEPTLSNGQTYAAPITVSETTVVRSTAFRDDWLTSGPATHTYVFASDLSSQSRMNSSAAVESQVEIARSISTLPVISLTAMVNGQTPRFTWSQNAEAPVSVEMVLPDGRSVQIDGGAKEVGGSSVRYAKDSLRLKFGGDYGASSLEFPVFDGADNPDTPAVDSFKRLTLRSGSHDSGLWQHAGGPHRSYMRAAWHDETMLELGHEGIHTRFVNVFLNGQYWGLYQLREHPDDHFMASYFGGDNEDYLGVNAGVVTSGDGTAWSELVQAVGSWDQFWQVVDPVNYVDFMLVSEYAGNSWDLRANKNWRGASSSTVGDDRVGFQFFHSDADVSMVSINGDITLSGGRSNFHGPADSWTALHQEADPEFLQLVADRVDYLFKNGGVLTEGSAGARWASLQAEISDAVHAEWARWNALTPATWQTGMNWFNSTFFPERTPRAIALLQSKGHLVPNLAEDPVVSDPGPLDWLVGDAVSVQFATDGGVMGWAATGLPDGVSIDPTIGLVSGVVESPGTFEVSVVATDFAGRQGQVDMIWTADYPTSSGLVLNEWNAVATGLVIDGGDSFFGAVAGNGGDWFELVVTEDHFDARGVSLWLSDSDNSDGVREVTDVLTFSDEALLGDLRAGTIITVSEELADDTSYDPSIGDWHLRFQSNSADAGAYFTAASQSNFSTNNEGWQLLIRDADNKPIFGPAGEGLGGAAGIGDAEVGELDADPSATTNATSGYDDGDASTFGAANQRAGVAQNLDPLRSWRGDADCDGAVNESDVRAILAYATGNSNPADCDVLGNGDMDGDGTAGLLDALMLATTLA